MRARRILIAVFFMLEFFHVQLVSIGFGKWKVRSSAYQTGPCMIADRYLERFADQLSNHCLACIGLRLQHYAFLIVVAEINFFVAEDLILWYFQPEHIVTVTAAHMSAIITAMLPFLALSVKLIYSYVHHDKEVDAASFAGSFHLDTGLSATQDNSSSLSHDSVWLAKLKVSTAHWNSKAHLDARARKATIWGFVWFFCGVTGFVSVAVACVLYEV